MIELWKVSRFTLQANKAKQAEKEAVVSACQGKLFRSRSLSESL